MRRLKQQKFLSLKFWWLEIQDQGVGRMDSYHGLSPWLVEDSLLSVSSHGHPSLPDYVLISSYKDASQIGLGPTLMMSFWFNYLLKDPIVVLCIVTLLI